MKTNVAAIFFAVASLSAATPFAKDIDTDLASRDLEKRNECAGSSMCSLKMTGYCDKLRDEKIDDNHVYTNGGG